MKCISFQISLKTFDLVPKFNKQNLQKASESVDEFYDCKNLSFYYTKFCIQTSLLRIFFLANQSSHEKRLLSNFFLFMYSIPSATFIRPQR
jgi:hypothetical protein